MNTHSQRLDITKYTTQGKDYIGAITTSIFLKEALETLHIDLRDQFCFVNELFNSDKSHVVILTATDKELVDEVIYQFEKEIKKQIINLVSSYKSKTSAN